MMSLIDKTSVANIISAFVIIAGVASVFMGIPSNEMLLLLTGAGIGYLFKNNLPKTKLNKNTGETEISTQ